MEKDKCPFCGTKIDSPFKEFWPCGSLKQPPRRSNVCYESEIFHLRELLREVITDHADFGQLFNAAFNDWKAEGCWSDWDEQTYQKHIALIAKIAKLTALEKP